jgi:hypothetical protein
MTSSNGICLIVLLTALNQAACWPAIIIENDDSGSDHKAITQLITADNQVVDVTYRFGLPVSNFGGVVTMNNLLYVIGGDAHDHRGTSVFDPTTNLTSQLADMTRGRRGISAAAVPKSNTIVVCGNVYSYFDKSDNTCEQFHAGNNVWSRIQNLPVVSIHSQMSLTLLGKAYIFGGVGGDGSHSESHVFRLDAGIFGGHWTTMSSMPVGLAYAGIIELIEGNGVALLCGGAGDGVPESACYLYDASTDTWTTSPFSLNEKRSTHTLVRFNGRIMCLGGGLQTVEVYDATTGWSQLPINGTLTEGYSMTIATISA